MSQELRSIVGAIAIGIGATLVMDVWNLFLRGAFGVPSLNYCFLGRWLRHMPSGVFRHANIRAAEPRSFECAMGWLAHYSIGIGFAVVFVRIAASEWLAQPTLAPALMFGIATVVFPFFILQPSIGLGVASSRTATPSRARVKSLATHTIFGIGLYLCALAVRVLLR
jgi:hypothetical protein